MHANLMIRLYNCYMFGFVTAGGRPMISPLPLIEGQTGESVTIVCESALPGEAVNNILLTYDPEQEEFVAFGILPDVGPRLTRTDEFSTTTYMFGPLTPSDNGRVLACSNSGLRSANATISFISKLFCCSSMQCDAWSVTITVKTHCSP